MNCETCRTLLEGSNLVYDTNINKVFCRRCASLLRICHTCSNGQLCDFESNLSSLPKQVQQTQMVGNAVMSQVVKNPERVKITCRQGCPCWSDEYGCVKQQSVESKFCLNNKWELVGDNNDV